MRGGTRKLGENVDAERASPAWSEGLPLEEVGELGEAGEAGEAGARGEMAGGNVGER